MNFSFSFCSFVRVGAVQFRRQTVGSQRQLPQASTRGNADQNGHSRSRIDERQTQGTHITEPQRNKNNNNNFLIVLCVAAVYLMDKIPPKTKQKKRERRRCNTIIQIGTMLIIYVLNVICSSLSDIKLGRRISTLTRASLQTSQRRSPCGNYSVRSTGRSSRSNRFGIDGNTTLPRSGT